MVNIISNDGKLYAELSGQLVKAAKMLGCLCQSIFVNKSLSVGAHKCVYLSTVVACCIWAVKAEIRSISQSLY